MVWVVDGIGFQKGPHGLLRKLLADLRTTSWVMTTWLWSVLGSPGSVRILLRKWGETRANVYIYMIYNTYIYTCINTDVYMYRCVDIHVYVCIYKYTFKYVYIYICVCVKGVLYGTCALLRKKTTWRHKGSLS